MSKRKMNKRIVIEEYLTLQNENGFDEPKWEEYYSCWSDYREVSGKEYESAKATQVENIVTFTIRYCNKAKVLLEKNATKKFRILIKNKENEELNKIFNIEYVNDFDNLHEYIDIKANEV